MRLSALQTHDVDLGLGFSFLSVSLSSSSPLSRPAHLTAARGLTAPKSPRLGCSLRAPGLVPASLCPMFPAPSD